MDTSGQPSTGELLRAMQDIQQRLTELEQTVHWLEDHAAGTQAVETPAAQEPPVGKTPVLSPAVEPARPSMVETPSTPLPAQPEAEVAPPSPAPSTTPPPIPTTPTPPGAGPLAGTASQETTRGGWVDGDWAAAVRKLHKSAGSPGEAPIDETPASKPAPKPTPKPAPKPAPKPQAAGSKLSLEQRVGARWMLFVGVGVLLLAAVFFFKYAIEKGWLSPSLRLLAGTAVGLTMIGLGEWSLIKRQLRLFAGGVMGGGVALLYFVVFVASPNGWYHLIDSPAAFGLMCVVTALGMALSLQTRMLSTAVIALVGAMATPMLLSTGENRQVLLMGYLLVVNAGFLALGLKMRWPALAPLALAGTAGIFGGWYAQHFARGAWPVTVGFAWAFVAQFIAYLVVGIRTRRLGMAGAKAMLLLVAAALTILLLVMHSAMNPAAFLACVGAMAALGLAACGRQNWQATCLAVMLCPLVAMGFHAVTGQDEPAGLLGLLAGMTAAMLAVAAWRRWQVLVVLALAQAACVTGLWSQYHYQLADWAVLNALTWVMLGEFIVYTCAAMYRNWFDDATGQGILVGAGSAAVVLWMSLIQSVSIAAMFYNLLPLVLVSLVICMWRGLPLLRIMALAQAVLITGLWTSRHYQPEAWPALNALVWALLGEFIVLTCVAMRLRPGEKVSAEAVLVGAGSAATVLWVCLVESIAMNAMLGTLLPLVVVALLICTWKDFSVLRVAALAWPAAMLFFQLAFRYRHDMPVGERWGLSVWAWGFYGLLTAQMLVRAFWKHRPVHQVVYAWVSTAAMAGMFGLTYGLLRTIGHSWMGSYTAALGAGAIVAAVLVRRLANRRVLGYSLLGQGLILLVLAVPIQFERANIPLAWAIQGVVVMFLARRLRSLALLIMAPSVLALAVMHFLFHQLRFDETMGRTAFVAFDTSITWGLLLGAAISAGLLAAGGILRAGKFLFEDKAEEMLAGALVMTAAVLWAARAGIELPLTGATWAWLILAGGLAATAIAARSQWLGLTGTAALVITLAKWFFLDTLAMRGRFGADTSILPLWNLQFVAGIALAASLPICASLLTRRVRNIWRQISDDPGADIAGIVAGIVCAVGVLYAVSFEIDRYFAGDNAGRIWQDPHQAMHTAYSVWWAIFATVMMVLGFARRHRTPRVLAMIVFAATLAKVLLVDMRNVESVYRILSFLCLSTLLIAASWLYHRYFRRLMAPVPTAPNATDDKDDGGDEHQI